MRFEASNLAKSRWSRLKQFAIPIPLLLLLFGALAWIQDIPAHEWPSLLLLALAIGLFREGLLRLFGKALWAAAATGLLTGGLIAAFFLLSSTGSLDSDSLLISVGIAVYMMCVEMFYAQDA